MLEHNCRAERYDAQVKDKVEKLKWRAREWAIDVMNIHAFSDCDGNGNKALDEMVRVANSILNFKER